MSHADARFAAIPGDAILGDAALVDRIEGARRHLAMLGSFHEDVRSTSHSLVPPPPDTWRSSAADEYVDGLDYLRARIAGAVTAIGDAESALEYCIRRMERRLDELRAAGAGT